MARHPPPGGLAHEPAEQCVAAERVDHGLRIGVEVEQPPAALDGRGEVAQIVESQRGPHVPGGRGQHHGASAVRQAQAAPVRAVQPLLHAGHGAGSQERQHARGVERRPVRQPQTHPTALGARRTRPAPAQLARRQREHLADRVVELAHAREAGGEGDIGDRQGGGLEQYARGLGAAGARQLERPGAEVVHEPPVQVALGVAEPPREPGHALAVDDAIGDQAHRAAHEVGAEIPLRRARHGVGATAHAGAEAGRLSGRRARVEDNVLALRRARRAARPAVDPGRLDRGEEPAVEAGVARLGRAATDIEVERHDPGR